MCAHKHTEQRKTIYLPTSYMYIPYRKRGGVVRRSRRAHNPKTNGSNPFLAMFFPYISAQFFPYHPRDFL